MTLPSLIEHYGYIALFIGTFLEGETILILAGLAAHLGHLELSGVILTAWAGSLFGDQLYYFIGLRHGTAFLEKHPSWKPKVHRASRLLHQHRMLVILFFRFIYGLRTVTPFAIGAAAIAPARFVPWNVLATLLWAGIIGCGGYLFGQALEAVMGELRRVEAELMAAIAGLAILLWIVRFVIRRHHERRGPRLRTS
jgi:membrane protein DedA with SNARE-associated domain